MPIANASQSRLGAVEEVTWGTTPATPAFDITRFVSEDLSFDVTTGRSEEIRADRNIADVVRLGQSASGGFNYQLSYGSFDKYIESALFSTFTTNVIKNGIVQKSFTLEKTMEQGATDSFIRYQGMIVDEMSLSCEAQKIITGGFKFMGKGASTATAIVAGATYPVANTKGLLSASYDFANLTLTGIAGTPKIMKVDLNVKNNLRGQPVVGANSLAGIGAGRCEVSGTLLAYFEDLAMYEAYVNNTSCVLSFTLGSVTAEKYTILMPKIKFEQGSKVTNDGNDEDVMAEMPFVAIFDATEAASIKITRAVA